MCYTPWTRRVTIFLIVLCSHLCWCWPHPVTSRAWRGFPMTWVWTSTAAWSTGRARPPTPSTSRSWPAPLSVWCCGTSRISLVQLWSMLREGEEARRRGRAPGGGAGGMRFLLLELFCGHSCGLGRFHLWLHKLRFFFILSLFFLTHLPNRGEWT